MQINGNNYKPKNFSTLAICLLNAASKSAFSLSVILLASKWQDIKRRSLQFHLLANDGAHFFFANFYCSER